jgi:hypothetical protein
MYRKDSFNANPIRHFANSEGFTDTTAAPGNYDSLESLNAFFIAFDDFNFNRDGITWFEFRNIGFKLIRDCGG